MTLPEGTLGRLLAVLLLGLLGAGAHAVAVGPLLAWHDSSEQRLAEQRALAARFERAAIEMPALRATVEALRARGEQDSPTLPGPTDTVATAGLQAALRDLVARHGGSVESAEALPARPQEGGLRRVGVRIQTSGDIFLLVSVLGGIEAASPPLIVETLQVRSALAAGSGGASSGADPTLSIALDVFGFRRN